MEIKDLLILIQKAAYKIRMNFCPGYLESVYQNALLIELRDMGLKAEKEVPLSLFYKGHNIGDFRADIIVNDQVILELKTVSTLNTNHEMQLVNYLHTTGIEYGFLINYGGDEYRIMLKTRDYRKLKEMSDALRF